MIRNVEKSDKQLFCQLVDEFYHTGAVLHAIPKECYECTFNEMVNSDIYLEGYIIEHNNEPAGYAIISKSFSPEVGGKIIWAEELYIRPKFRGCGLGKQFFSYIDSKFANTAKRFRLEVEPKNERAMSLYERLGYENLDYVQMVKDI